MTEPQTRVGGLASFRALLRQRNFVLLWLGEGVSALGDMFHYVALPWLVLQLTGDPLATGTVLAAAGVPRAVFMLVGGALTDRVSPRSVMLATSLARLVLVSLMAGLILTGAIELWMLFGLALALGLANAFYYPAQAAIVPRLVDKEHLQSANSLVQGTIMISVLLGPAIAGALIASLDTSAATGTPGLFGLGIAFAVDATTFLVSALTLVLIRMSAEATQVAAEASQDSILASIRIGLVAVWHDKPLRVYFLVIAAINLLFFGPFDVGVPVLADTRYPEGAVALGLIVSAYGGGSLVGTALAGLLPRPSARRFPIFLLAPSAVLGVGLIIIGVAPSAPYSIATALALGLSDGYVMILFNTWLQIRTPPALLGRVMSLLMFAAFGLAPLSLAVAGALIRLNLTAVFVVAGALMVGVVLLAAGNPAVRQLGELPGSGDGSEPEAAKG